MNGWDDLSISMVGLLEQRSRLQKVINYRKAEGYAKYHRRCMMIKVMGSVEFDRMMFNYSGLSDEQLIGAIGQLNDELDMRLDRLYMPK